MQITVQQLVATALNNRLFTFDFVHGPETPQSGLYQSCVSALEGSFLQGFNATILAYGQTGSGKTFSMGTASNSGMSDESKGIVPRFVHNMFEQIKVRASVACDC